MGPECLGDWRARYGVPTAFCKVSEGFFGQRSFVLMGPTDAEVLLGCAETAGHPDTRRQPGTKAR